jgi:hypothetical protein
VSDLILAFDTNGGLSERPMGAKQGAGWDQVNFFSEKLRAHSAKLRVRLDCFAADGTHGSLMVCEGETARCQQTAP